VGRAVISLFVAFTVVAIVVVNMPSSVLKTDAGRITDPFVQAVGLDQNWAIFSAPRSISAYVDGRVDFADGSSVVIPISTDHGFGAFVDYRWQKYEELIRGDDGKPLWAAYAHYLAQEARTASRVPVRVSLMRRFSETRPPGPGPLRGPWRTFTFFVYTVPSTS
jgi:hypothetical protein